MLKKLILISLAAGALTACGGSLGPEPKDLTVAESTNPTPTPTPEPEMDCGPTLTNYMFTSQADVDAWVIHDGGTNVQLSHDPDTQSAMLITPLAWTGDDTPSQRQARMSFAEPMDLTGATVAFRFNLPLDYLEDDGLTLQFVLEGETTSVDSGVLTMADFVEAATDEGYEGPISLMNPSTLEFAVAVTGPAGGNAAAVTDIGMQLTGMPNVQTILDPIPLKRVTISVPSTNDLCPSFLPPLKLNFDAGWDNDNWQARAGAPDLSYDAEEEALVISPNWDATDNNNERTVMYVAAAGEVADLTGATISYTLNIPQYYLDNPEAGNPGIRFQFYIQQNSGSYSGDFGSADIALADAESLGNGDYRFERAVTTDIRVAVEDAVRIGLKLHRGTLETGGQAGPDILLRNVTVNYAAGVGSVPSGPTEVVIDFASGIGTVGNDGVVTLSHDADAEALRIDPDFTDTANKSIFVILEESQIESFAGASVEFVVNVPQTYLDAGLALQPFVQQNSGSYEGEWSGWVNNVDLVAGDNTFTYSPATAPEGSARVGIQLKEVVGVVEEDLLIKNIKITYSN